MANLSAIKLPNNTTYTIKDKNALPLTGGSVTGPVSFGNSVSIDEATIGDLVVNGSGSFTNNIQVNTINGVTVGTAPKFTDTVTTATTTGSGNAVTAITASNGVLTITKGTTFLTSHQDISGKADKATTLSGYGITDAKIASGVITLGSNTITPLTSSSTLNAAKLSGTIPTSCYTNSNTTYTLTNALSSHKFTWTLTAGGSGSGSTTTTAELVAGSNITLTDDTTNKKITIAATDTTYSSKTAVSGGTDVSLVTTGEKYTWNSKTSNTGTITSVKTTAGAHTTINVTSGAANFNVPTKTSHLTNDSGFVTSSGVTSIATSGPISGGTITGTGTISHSNSGVTSGTYGVLSNYGSVTWGGSYPIPAFTVNATGHITVAGVHDYPIPDNTATSTEMGLMSAADKQKLDGLLDLFYPVGSYYETSDTTFDPNTAWGGTWKLETPGQVHVSGGTGYTVSDTYTNSDNADGTVGTKQSGNTDAIIPYHNHETTVTQPKIPNHVHKAGNWYVSATKDGGSGSAKWTLHALDTSGSSDFSVKGNNTGNPTSLGSCTGGAVTVQYAGTDGNLTNANMQPYIAVNRWHRTA